MRLMAIVFFMNLLDQLSSPARSAAGVDTQFRELILKLLGRDQEKHPLKEFLKGLPKERKPPDRPQASPSEFGAPISSLLRDAGIEQKWLVGDAMSELETAVTDLDLKISVYPLKYPSTSTAATAGAITAEDAWREIKKMQPLLKSRYDEFLKLAAEQTDVIDKVKTMYEKRITALTSWRPDSNAAIAWQLYGPPEDPDPVIVA
jgi:hypothetical protein